MPRHHLSEQRVQDVVDRLVEQLLRIGSVHALADALTTSDTDGLARIHPNRLHGLLSEDTSRSVNTSTLDAIEAGLTRLEVSKGDSPDSKVYHLVAAAADQVPVDATDSIGWITAHTGLPAALVRRIARTAPILDSKAVRQTSASEPDWSWQADAVRASLRSLQKGPRYRAGLVIPTGGGKTNIALQVALRWLHQDNRADSIVLWVTHRRRLHTQARRGLQQLLRQPGAIPEGASSLFAHRIDFVMTSELDQAVTRHGERLSLVIVDEAHHAAAPSYEPIFTLAPCPALFLTATPNRTDELPLGIDEVAYTISYRELLECGCLVTPLFDPPLDLPGLDWSTADGLRDLADYLLERTDEDFRKVLVTVSTRDRAEVLYEAVASMLDERGDHPFDAGDIGFVHADRSSAGISPSDFLDEFTARPAGLLVATGQLIGEGFDDPSIDSVVITYPSSSISHLMQVAGRALRYAPGKTSAHVVQVRESPLQYHFDQRWLYQDISDRLRPDLVDLSFNSREDLIEHIDAELKAHNVVASVRDRVLVDIGTLGPNTDVHLMLTGVPYFGPVDRFTTEAEWGAILVTSEERHRFVQIFNDVSARSQDIKEHHLYLPQHIAPDSRAGSLWKSYVDLISAMEYARREITGVEYSDQPSRPYRRNLSTTWLRYVTFNFDPSVPVKLEQFLKGAFNADTVRSDYINRPDHWASAAKLELPLTGTVAYLLTTEQAEWLEMQRRHLVEQLRDLEPDQAWPALATWTEGLAGVPVPVAVVLHIGQLTRPDRFVDQYLRLAGPVTVNGSTP